MKKEPNYFLWAVIAVVCGFAIGFCTPAPASELDSPMLNELRDLNERTRLSEERRQFEWAERDMQDRRNRYESERRYEERRNDRYFGWDRRSDRRRDR